MRIFMMTWPTPSPGNLELTFSGTKYSTFEKILEKNNFATSLFAPKKTATIDATAIANLFACNFTTISPRLQGF
jgi:hypothetical protein